MGYVFPPLTSGNLPVELKVSEQKGNWSDIGLNSGAVALNVFSLWLDHGSNPVNAHYEYVVVPGAGDPDSVATYSKEIPVRTISNTPALQAVRNDSLGVTGIVFYAAGEVGIRDGLNVWIDKPGIVLVRESVGKITVTVADPPRFSSDNESVGRLKVERNRSTFCFYSDFRFCGWSLG